MRGLVPPPRLPGAAALLACFFVVGAVPACQRTAEPPEREQLERARAELLRGRPIEAAAPDSAQTAPGLASASTLGSSSPVARALIEIRGRAMSLSAPPPLPRHIALGKGFVLQLARDEALVIDTRDGHEITRVAMKEARAAVALPAGSVLVAALDGSYRFDPGQKRAHPVTRLSLLPGFVVEPRRGSQEQVWVLQAPLKKVQCYSLGSDAGLGLDSERVLANYDGGAFTTLSDGSFLYTAAGALGHSFGSGEPKALALPDSIGLVWRLAAADRIDRAWAATVTGELALLELGVRTRVVRTIQTGLVPFDFAATASRLALVSVSERAGQPRRFSLTVYSREGSQIFSHALSVDEISADADWAARVAANKEVVLGEDPPRVAVGGASSLRVFEVETGRELSAISR